MTEIRMSFPVVAQAEQDIEKTITFMRTKLDQMEAAMKKISADWSGEAQQAYQAKQQKINTIESGLIDTLTAIHRAVGNAKQRLMARDKSGAQSFSSSG